MSEDSQDYINAGSYDRYIVPTFSPLADLLLEKIAAITKHQPSVATRILDLCTGTGLVLSKLAQKYPAALLVGADLSEQMLRLAGQHLAVANLVVMDGTQLGFLDSSFSLVTLHFGFHHLDATKSLAELARIVAPGGLLAIQAFNIGEATTPEYRRLAKIFTFLLKKYATTSPSPELADIRAQREAASEISPPLSLDLLAEQIRRAGFAKLETVTYTHQMRYADLDLFFERMFSGADSQYFGREFSEMGSEVREKMRLAFTVNAKKHCQDNDGLFAETRLIDQLFAYKST